MSIVSVYAVFADVDQAKRIGRAVIDLRLAACVNIMGPIHSIYRCQGEVQSAHEVAAIFKTSDEAVDALMTRIAGLHSYDVPCVVALPVEKVLQSYAQWVEESVG